MGMYKTLHMCIYNNEKLEPSKIINNNKLLNKPWYI